MPATVEREKVLISRIIAGETDLFHELIRPYERMVYLSVLTMLRNEQEAEDASQEVMINAFRHLKSFRGDAKFSTWLVTIAMNEARQRLRKAKAAQFESLDESKEEREGDFTPAVLTDWREIPSEALEKKEMRQKLREAVEQLPPIYREVLVQRISEYLDHQLDPEMLMDIEKHLENCEVCSAILDSTRNILILTADNRTYELPVGYSERLHARLEKVIREAEKPKNDSA